jgi:hypothetical protein
MPDYRKMYDRDFIYSYDLDGRDVTVVIDRVTAGEVTGTGGKKSKKPVLYMRGKEKGLALCKTNARTIASLYGSTNTDDWIGKAITLYPAKTMFGGEEVDCIRIRNVAPKPRGATSKRSEEPVPEPDQMDPEPPEGTP